MVLHEQGISRWQGCGSWGFVDEGVGIEWGGGEVWVDKVSCARTFLSLPFSMMESPLFGVEEYINVPPCRNGI